MATRTLLIATAKHGHIRDALKAVAAAEPRSRLSLLLLERERGHFEPDPRVGRLHYFAKPLHPLSLPLARALAAAKPDHVCIVCGLYYDHDNVVGAVETLLAAMGRRARVSLFVQREFCDPPRLPRLPLWRHLLTALLHLGIAAALRLLAPLTTVRAGEIFSTRIGHLAYDCEIYLCERELGYHKGCFDLFHLKDGQAANQTLFALFARHMRITPLARHIHEAVRRYGLEGHELHLVTRRLGTARDPECLIPATAPHIAFSPGEHDRAAREMAALGIPRDRPYVCLLGRDPAYLEWLKPLGNDSRLQEPRNIDINDYLPTVDALAGAGCTVLRMGSKVMAALATDNPRAIDYAKHPARSDFMDIYLSATCRFFVGSGSGLQEVPVIFRVPCLLINGFQFELLQACSPQNILLPQLIRDNELGRILRVDEVLALGLGDWGVERFAESTRYRALRNTPEEIREAAVEMHRRLEGTWVEEPGDAALQKRFWGLFTPSVYNSCFVARIGADFLRRHAPVLLPEAVDGQAQE
ncbi:TIGR04372 family glycosyltransferase [Solidesulfovibrio carbinolicus]|uniref:TIGR04372 family glycosyltransferase n=1 Tax=Solidesulfovibrio carbinolicus TaxID=296842 RepID=A0A4P6HQP8_9BACT|nr:TIGR04372 family glycosyltransferase [Solidesulfovibrio carbinolicus]QAZ69643.1 hypothetical protein C3Y92_20440 [Solidesulfovibrio carbinolicus]